MWDTVSGIQHFVGSVLIDTSHVSFELTINLPKPRYERQIVQRDEFGRMIHSRSPPYSI